MENFLAQIENALSQQAYPTRPAGLYEPIAYALSGGGKRVRPHLTLLACSLYSDELEKAIPAALSVETYHNHTLLHDDLMDGPTCAEGALPCSENGMRIPRFFQAIRCLF